MENETQEASQESTESVITDEMLDRAAEGVDEEVVEEETTEESTEEETDEVPEEEEETTEEEVEGETEEVETETEEAEDLPEEPEDNSERSRLGRKVKELEDALLRSKIESEEKLNATLEKLNAFLGKTAEPEEEEFFEMPETRADFDRLVRERIEALKQEETTQKSQQTKDYESGYIDTVASLLDDETPEDKQAILEVIDAEFNIKHSKVDSLQNGMKDAAKNVLAAKTKLLQSKGVKEVPLKGGKPKAPLGGEAGSKMPKKTKSVPKLDPVAAAFAKETGMSDEAIIKALG